jgi:hypothetical protein
MRRDTRGTRRVHRFGLLRLAFPLLVLLLAAYVAPVEAGAVSARAGSPNYRFSVVSVLGAPAPGGGSFTTDFEPSAINASGEVAFTADVDTNGDEGVFVARNGTISQVLRAGLAAPGGSTFGPFELGRLGLNDGGDVAASFTLNPFDPNVPFGLNGGVFRFSHSSHALSGVELPGTQAPGGGTFKGTYVNNGINNRADIVYPGLATGSAIGTPGTPPNYNGMSLALFRQGKHGASTRIVGPGDPAPGGHVFDDAWNGSINNGGDIAFSAHVVGDPCINIGVPFACGDSLYLRDGASGAIRSLAHQGDPAPGGSTFTVAFGGLVNSRDQVAFIGGLTSPANAFGVFRDANGTLSAVARPSDPMPGGGAFLSASNNDATYGMNNRGDISFAAMLNTDTTGDGFNDTGVYVASEGSLRLVARSGTVIPGVGTMQRLGQFTFPTSPAGGTGGMMNDRGQVLFNATLNDGTGVLLVATPE